MIVQLCSQRGGMDRKGAAFGKGGWADDTHQTSGVPQSRSRQDADSLATEDHAGYESDCCCIAHHCMIL